MTTPGEFETETTPPPAGERAPAKNTAVVVGIIAAAVLILIVAVVAISLMVQNPATTETLRDIAIILLALEGFLIGLALIILIIQLARLTVLLETEVKPILESTNQTVNTLRGTTVFLSDNLANPVIRANSMAAAIRRAFELVRSLR